MDPLSILAGLRDQWQWLLIPMCLLGGFEFRRRGGMFGDWIRQYVWRGYGTFDGRWLFALSTALWIVAVRHDGRLILLGPAIFAGLVAGWLHSADLGRDGDKPWWLEFSIMTIRGGLMTAPAGVLLYFLDRPWYFGLSGLALGAIYELGHRTKSSVPNFNSGMEMAEFYTGLWIWLAALALI